MLAWRFSFLDRSSELVDLWKISDGGVSGFIIYLVATVLMFAGWIWSILIVRGRSLQELWFPVVGITAITYFGFVLVYPATAIDVYIYAARSHLFTDYGLNPSVAIPRQLWEIDPFVQYASWEWSDRPSPYGPLWNAIAAPATAFGNASIQTSVLWFKAMMVASACSVAMLVYDIARKLQPELALSATIAWLWSPIVLWEGLANSHNDVTVMVLVVGALWCWHKGYDGVVIPLLGASALLKIVTVMLIPVAIATIIVRTGWNRRLLHTVTQTVALSIGVLWVAFVPFYDVGGAVDAIQSQRDVWVTSPILVLDAMNMAWSWGLDLEPAFERFSTLVIIALTVLGTGIAWKRPHLLPRIAYEQLFWFLLLATSNLRPWYAIWLVALAVVLRLGMPLVRAAAWTVGALLAYGYSGWIQNWSDPEWLVRSGVNLAITLVPVLLVMGWNLWRIVSVRWHPGSAERSSSTSGSPARQ